MRGRAQKSFVCYHYKLGIVPRPMGEKRDALLCGTLVNQYEAFWG